MNYVYDCFSFFNELDLLELRLNELDSVVDRFVLVEATLTHSGKHKPLYYLENKRRFAKFVRKIIHIIVDDMPVTKDEIESAITPQDRKWLDTGYQLGDDWVRERFQRNQIMQGLVNCKPDDIIIIEDADEFVKKSVLENIDGMMVDGSNAVGQELRTYYMNWKCTNMPWWGTKILRYKFVNNPSEHRFHTPASKYIYDGGYHFNFLGGANAIKQKILSYAHQEFAIPDVLDNLDERLLQQKDALGRLYQYEVIPIDDITMPKYVIDNPEKFEQFMYRCEL